MKKFLLMFVALCCFCALWAQKPVVSKAAGFAITPPVRSFGVAKPEPGKTFKNEEDEDEVNEENGEIIKEIIPGRGGKTEGLITNRRDIQTNLASPPITSFDGNSNADNQAAYGGIVYPPDDNGDVGPNHYVQTTNLLVGIFNKTTGALVVPKFKMSTLFASLGPPFSTLDRGDPIVLYDQLADRWLISQFLFTNVNGGVYYQMIAISQTGDPTGAYYVYAFLMPNNKLNDYPHFGVWPDGYYMSDNQFTNGGSYSGAGAFAFDRAKMLVGDPSASFIYFDQAASCPSCGGQLPTDLDGFAVPPIGTPNLFMEFRADEYGDPADGLRIFAFHADFNSPANSTFTQVGADLPLAAFDARNPAGRADIEQPGTAIRLDGMNDRLMYRLACRILPGGAQSYVGNFTVNVSGVNPTTAATYQAGIKWFELRRSAVGVMSVNDEGIYAPGAGDGAAGRNIWMAGIAQDGEGNIGLGFSASSTTLFPSILYTGRLTSDPAGIMAQGENTMVAGSGVQLGTANRWGDYSSMSVDPIDECTFWYTQEYYTAASQAFSSIGWLTRIGSFKVNPACVVSNRGTISGTVTNCQTGLPIANAIVTTPDGFFTTTNATGQYSILAASGTYTVVITASGGYNTCTTNNVVVTNGGNSVVNCCIVGVPIIVSAGATITAESCIPINSVIDPNETVTVDLSLSNTGGLNTSNLVATLQATGGVTAPNGPQNYGLVVGGGASISRPFSFTAANLTCGALLTATLQLQDGATNLGTVTYTFITGATTTAVATFSFTGPAVAIPDNVPAGINIPITVSGAGTKVTDLNFRFDPLTGCDATIGNTNAAVDHTYLGDLTFKLTSPAGTTVIFMQKRGGSGNNICNLFFDDDGAYPPISTLSSTGGVSGNYAPENPFSAFDGQTANGNWILNVSDNAGIYVGSVRRFSIILTTSTPVCCINSCIAPVISCPANIIVDNTTGQCGAIVTYPAATATGTTPTITYSHASGSIFPVGTTTVTATATNDCGTSSCTFTIIVVDAQDPSITCPANISVNNAANQCGATVTYTATASDNCPGVSVSYSPASGSFFPVGTTTVTATATDAAGRTASCTFTVTVVDAQNPSITCPANITVNNTINQCGASVTYAATASDNCPGVSVSYSPASGSFFPVGTTTVTATATDAATRTASCTFTVTVVDAQNPSITCPANITVNNTINQCGATVTYTATASDNCPGVSVSYSHASGSVFPVGTTTVTATATDAASRTASCTFTVTVIDNQKPSLTCPGPVTVSCASEVPAPDIASVTGVSDNCPGTIMVTHGGDVISNQTCANRYTITRTYKATDATGNFATCTQTITVNDQTGPVFTVVGPYTVSCASAVHAIGPAEITSASDNCGGQLSISANEVISNQTCANRYTITRTYTVYDVCGNTLSHSIIITVNDQTPPTLTCPGPVTVSCPSQVPAPNIESVTGVSDNCGGTVTVTHNGDVISNQTAAGYTITRTYRATDVCGNFAECTQIITVNDITAPTITCPANIIKNNDPDQCGATATYAATANDNCSGVSVSYSHASGSFFPVGTTIVTATATDAAGLTASCTFTVTVVDAQNPSITCPANITKNNDPNQCGATVTYAATASDNCPGVSVSYSPASGSFFSVGTTTVTATARDAVGHTTSCSFTVTVTDNQAPVITTCPVNKTSASDAGSCTKTFTAAQIGLPTATDNCSYSISWSRSDGAANLADPFVFGITTITWTATDGTGLTATCSQTININKITTTTTVTVTPNVQQYSDKVTFVATVMGSNCGTAGQVGGTVTFKIGTLTMGTATVQADGTAILADVALVEPTLNGSNPTNGPLKPGAKTVTAVYSATDADYTVNNPTAPLTINCEDARAYYTGALYTSTSSATSSIATITLSATVKDISATPDAAGDVSSGDIRNATVTFINITNNSPYTYTTIATVPVGLVNPGDLTVGTATYNYPVTINGDAQQYTIGIIVNNYYCRNSSDDNTVVEVTKPLGELYISGGGYLILTSSAGIKAGTAGTKNNFGFNVKYNRAKTNLQGNINTIVRKMEAGVMRVYQIKGNSMTSLAVNENCPKTATFNGKANITDITNPLLPVAIGGNATLQVTMTDMGEPGSSDKIAITVWDKDGGLWFASNWNGTTTVEQTLGAGNLKVHGGAPCTSTSRSETQPEITQATPEAFKVTVSPNPSSTDFKLQVTGSSSELISVRLLDVNGVVKEQRQVFTKTSSIRVGAKLVSGTYFAEVVQGTKRKVMKLIKAN